MRTVGRFRSTHFANGATNAGLSTNIDVVLPEEKKKKKGLETYFFFFFLKVREESAEVCAVYESTLFFFLLSQFILAVGFCFSQAEHSHLIRN